VLAAFWLGLLTSAGPCALASNVAALSFIGRHVAPLRVLLAGLLYTLGRMSAYAALGALLVGGLLSVPAVSHFLLLHLNRMLGPVLVVAGMFLLELLPRPWPPPDAGQKVAARLARWRLAAAFPLGALFAAAFCPVSAALFFGSLVPLAAACRSGLLIPSVYGAGTGLPVAALAVLLATGAERAGAATRRLAQVERGARRVTGAAFVLAGIYYALVYIYGVGLGI
jgi:hypothetical protein